ncbi:MAG: hypothetical protein KAJ00_05885 [Deltaproteobacteria bacterium]|jgi:hypothetical protein|nr:hypothetical protein [Deltaproteobacteria bacterium]MCK5187141.1 hypothetical protein [Deltaproteobacteria bacterium]MCK5514008.1 hypothetical protein [Deltaproteobacteria bacterium]
MTTKTSEMDKPINNSRKDLTEFDHNRATLRDKNIFPPLYVNATISLVEALKRGDVRKDNHLMVIERNDWMLALLTKQMIYHHVAQGEMAGEPWMVSL